jgi:zinc/manganese transport system substrate-binding protein
MRARPLAALTPVMLAGVVLAGVAACGTGQAPAGAPAGADDPVTVVATTDVYGAIAQAVGGDRIEVTALLDDPSADPHSYEATPADAAAVAGADLVLLNGGGYDDFATRLVESSGRQPTVLDAVQVSGLEGAEAAGEAHAEEESHAEEEGHAEEAGADEHGAFNEHVWYSLPTVQRVATRLAADLGALDPAGAPTFTANAERFSGQLDELITQARAIGAAHPGARLAVTEPVPGYLLQTAGLSDVTPAEFTEAVEEDADPPAAALAETLALLGPPEPVAALVLNAQTTTPTTDQVRAAAQTGGVPVVEMTETLPEGAPDYPGWMGGQIDALAAALNGG